MDRERIVQRPGLTEEKKEAVAAGETIMVPLWCPRETETVTVTVTVGDAVPTDHLD